LVLDGPEMESVLSESPC